MTYQTLLVDITHHIGIVWMNRPKVHNALNETLIAELTAAMRTLGDDPAVRAVVLAGAGESFCAGADMGWMQRRASGSLKKSQAAAAAFATLLHTIHSLRKPTIARVQGPVFSDGIGLVAVCDMAVAAYEAEFCLAEVRFGLIPAVIGPYLVRAVGERAALRYVLTAERFTAAEAYRIGLLSDIAPGEELDARINELLGQLILGGPIAQAHSKARIRMAAGSPATPELIEESAAHLAEVCASAEGREGIRFFREKTEPSWWIRPKKAAAKKTPTKTRPKRA